MNVVWGPWYKICPSKMKSEGVDVFNKASEMSSKTFRAVINKKSMKVEFRSQFEIRCWQIKQWMPSYLILTF